MGIYTPKKQKLKKSSSGCATPPKVLKLDVFGIKDTIKTNKDLGMLYFIPVEYSFFFRW